jgi:hypothetical protein
VALVLNFYMDDSGTRKPDRKPSIFDPSVRDAFALGGVLIKEEDEGSARTAYTEFCKRWGITYPLHSVKIRHHSDEFSWLVPGTRQYRRFMVDLTRFLTRINVLGLACVIDRPGYDARYRSKYGRRQWHLCRTAFCIAVERAAKFARADGRKLRVLPERSCRDDERRIGRYFKELQAQGTPFDPGSSSGYRPLGADQFQETLHEIRFKRKTSPMAQVADLYLWPMVMAGYQDDYRAYAALRDAGRFIETHVTAESHAELATKYSCFELVRKHRLT